MSLEQEIQDRLLGITPPYEAQLHYAAIFRVSPDLAFAQAYVDGWLASASVHKKIINKLTTPTEENNVQSTC